MESVIPEKQITMVPIFNNNIYQKRLKQDWESDIFAGSNATIPTF
jgi:hypothetical protein